MYGTPFIDFFAIYLIYLHKYQIALLIGAAPIYSIIFFILRKYQYLYLLFILYLLAWILNISLLLDPAFQQFMAPIVAGE